MQERRIIIDFYSAGNRNVGVGEYSYKLGEALYVMAGRLKERGVSLCYIVPRELLGHFGDDVEYLVGNKFTRSLYRYLPYRCDLFHAVHQFCLVKFMRSSKKSLLTLHDINFVYEKQGSKIEKYRRKIGRRLSEADGVVVISNFVEEDVRRIYPDLNKPVSVIYNGVSDLTAEAAAASSLYPETGEDFLFHISSLQPKKNPGLLIEMMRHLPEEKLLLAGNWNTGYGDYMKDVIAKNKITNVIPLTNVDNTVKGLLYARCKAFLFPSLCEGFGLPPLEAMRFGKPVFLSRLTSLPEVGGKYAFYWDKLEPEAMASVVKKGLEEWRISGSPDEVRRWSCRFSWEKCAADYAGLYLKMLGLE